MKSQRLALRVAAVIFALICLGHIWRIVAQAHIEVAGNTIPMWLSTIAAVITAGLSLWMWIVSGESSR